MTILKDIKRTIHLLVKQKLLEVPTSNKLSEKIIVITGTSTGLGKCLVEYMHNSGANVIALSRSAATNQDKLHTLVCDITNESEVAAIFDQIHKEYGKIDVLINNAAVTYDKQLSEITSDIIDEYLAVNIKSNFLTSKYAAEYMKEQKQGTIINIGSKISRNSMISPYKSLYASTKYAVEGMTNVLKNELKPFGIRVIAVLPSAMTNFVSSKAGNHLSPYRVAEIIGDIIRYDEVDFENFVIKNKYQNI